VNSEYINLAQIYRDKLVMPKLLWLSRSCATLRFHILLAQWI